MKIQIASDLHLEFLRGPFPGERIISPAADAEVLVLAGDIGNSIQAVELFKDWPVPVLLVAGNHEFYGGVLEEVRAELHRAAAGTNVRFLDNSCVDLGGVRFLGATLWTDYRLDPSRTRQQMIQTAERELSDHRTIRCGSGLFTAQKALAQHELSRTWLNKELSKPYSGKTVVISHHGPHPLSVHARYAGNPVNAAFVSDLSDLIAGACLWIHGHTHHSFQYSVNGCRVVANPAGYALNKHCIASAKALIFENKEFQRDFVVQI